MAAPQASNDTFLPRAVVRRSAAIAERYRAREAALNPDPNAQPAPDAAPGADGSPPAEPQHVTPPPDTDPRENDPNYWKQRFRVTEGILARERVDSRARFDELNQRITELQEKTLGTKQAGTDPTEIDLSQFYTPEEIETYGEEQCRVMAKTSIAAARKMVEPIKEERERSKQQDAADVKSRFKSTLTELRPTWEDDDKQPAWKQWLAEEDANGVVRQQLLDIHVGSGNAKAIAKMFTLWEKETARPVPPITPNGGGASHGSEPPAPTQGDVKALTAPSKEEIKDYYKRSALGKVKDSERVAFDARLRLRHPDRQ